MATILILCLYGILTLWITVFIIVFRKQITCMVGMMGAMSLGMTVGLGTGALLAVLIPGQFFESTMLSILIGGTVGVSAGIPISLMAVMDGLLAGMMGGMMGTMLLVMIPSPQTWQTVQIITVLCNGILLVLFLMLQGEIKKDLLQQKSFLLSKPLPIFTLILFSLVFSQYNFSKDDIGMGAKIKHSANHSEHSHNRSEAPTKSNNQVKELFINAEEYMFTPSSIRVVAGEKIKFTLNNLGQEEHDFEIIGTNIHMHAMPGQKSSIAVRFEEAGYYQAVCTFPGHKEEGMSASIQVTQP